MIFWNTNRCIIKNTVITKTHECPMLQGMTLWICGTVVLNLPLTLCAELHARRRIPASVRWKPKWRTVLPAMVLCSNWEGMLPDFSKTAASGSSAGAGDRSGLLELTVCFCWVIDNAKSPTGCIVTREGGDWWCVPQSHPPSPIPPPHTFVGGEHGFHLLVSLSHTLSHFFFHQGFFPAACVFVGVQVCACVRVFCLKFDWT